MTDARQSHDCGLTGVNTEFSPIIEKINKDALASFNNIVRLIQTVDTSAAENEIQATLDKVAEFMKGSVFGDLESFLSAMGLPKLTKPPSRGFGTGGKNLGDPSGALTPSEKEASKKLGTNVATQARRGSSGSTSCRPSVQEENDNERLAALGIINCFGTVFADSSNNNFASFRNLFIQVGRDYNKLLEVAQSLVSGEHLIVYSLVTMLQFKALGGQRQSQTSIEAQLGFKLNAQELWWGSDNTAYVPTRSYLAHNTPLWEISEKYDMSNVEITTYSVDYLAPTNAIVSRFMNLGFTGQALQAVVSELDLLELELESILKLLTGIYDNINANTILIDMQKAQQYMNFRVQKIPDREFLAKLIAKFGEERTRCVLKWRTDIVGMDLSLTSSDLLRYLNTKTKAKAGSTIISNSLRSKDFDYVGKAQSIAYVCKSSVQLSKNTKATKDLDESRTQLNLLISYLGGLIIAEKISPIISNEMSEKVSFFVDKATRTSMGDMATAPGITTSTTTSVSNIPSNPNDVVGTTTETTVAQDAGTTTTTKTTTTVFVNGAKTITTEITTVKTQDNSTVSTAVIDELVLGKSTNPAFTGERANADLKSFGSSLGDGQMIAGGQKSFDSAASLLVRVIDINSTFQYDEKIQQLAKTAASDLGAYGEKADVLSRALGMTAAVLQATCGRMQDAIKMIFDSWGTLIKDVETLVSALSALLSKSLTNCLFSVNLDLRADFMLGIVAETINNIVKFLEAFNKLIRSVVDMMCLGSCMITSLLGDLANYLTFPCIKSIQLPNPIDDLIRQIEAICLFASDLALKAGNSSFALKSELTFAPLNALLVVAQSCKCSDYGFASVKDALADIPMSLSRVIPSPVSTPYVLPV